MAANKLTVDQRAAVLVRYGTGEKVHALAAEFGITDSAIRGLARTRGMPRRKNGRPPR